MAIEDLHLDQLDVKKTFLHDDLDEDNLYGATKRFSNSCEEELGL